PSLSLTLSPLRTITRVRFDKTLERDRATLDGVSLVGRPLERIADLLARVRAHTQRDEFAHVETENELPTAAGLASSASGFAALAVAALSAAGAEASLERVSELARRSGAWAARSAYGGWVSLDAGATRAERVAPPDQLPVVMLVAVTASGPKAVG